MDKETQVSDLLFSELYDVGQREALVFGQNYTGLTRVDRHEARVIATYAPENADGRPVKVMVTGLPARFYTVNVPSYCDLPGCTLSTGSGDGMAKLAHQIAKCIASGMLVVRG